MKWLKWMGGVIVLIPDVMPLFIVLNDCILALEQELPLARTGRAT